MSLSADTYFVITLVVHVKISDSCYDVFLHTHATELTYGAFKDVIIYGEMWMSFQKEQDTMVAVAKYLLMLI